MKTLVYVFIFCFCLAFTVTNVFAHNNPQDTGCNEHNHTNCPSPTQICGNGEHTGNPHCITPTTIPTNTPTEEVYNTPTPTITPTDEISPTVTPTDGPICLQQGDEDIQVPCPTNTLTPSPTAGQSAYPTPTEGSGGYFDDHLGCGTHSCVSSNNSSTPSTPNTPQNPPRTGRAEN